VDLRQIRYFVAVAESKSLTRAVERLNVAQPALSLNVKSLETELGAQLFNRSQRGMELTDAGSEFLRHAYEILEQVAEAERSVSNLEEDPHGIVSVAMPPSLSHALTLPLYRHVAERYPRIELDLEEGLKSNLLDSFERGEFDLLVHFDIPRSKLWSRTKVFRENLYLVSPITSPDDDDNSDIPFSDLAKHEILIPSVRNTLGELLDNHAADAGVELHGPAVHTAYHQTLLLMKAGVVSAVLPMSAVHDLIGDFVNARKIVDPELHREVSIVTPTHRAQSYATRRVSEAIKSVVASLWESKRWRGELLFDPHQKSQID